MPTLLLDRKKCLQNIEFMSRKATGNNISLRPHCKTHQSAEIANWTRDFDIRAITVSSFRMARYFANEGWEDILVAFPFQPGEMENLIEISGKCKLSILIDSPAALPFLNNIPNRVDFYIDIDTGYGRTGIRTENPELIEQVIIKAESNPKLTFRGFYCHAGHSYKALNRKEMNSIHQKAMDDLADLKKTFSQYSPRVLYGDTPNCSIQEEFGEIDEITPGNFFFYDLIQYALGACSLEEIAVALECRVAGRYPLGDRILVHGGAIHFSKQRILQKGSAIYGRLVKRTEHGWTFPDEERFLTGLSQEHGIMEPSGTLILEVNIGDLLLFQPVHSCLTANLMREYRTLEGSRITTINSI